MKRIIVLTIALSFVLSACFNFTTPLDPSEDVRLSTSANVASRGDPITFTSDHMRGDASFSIVEGTVSINPPQTVRNLPVLLDGSASVLVDEGTTLTVTLEEGRTEALGRDIYRFDRDETVIAFGGERTQVSGSSSDIRLRSDSADETRDGISSATFRIVKVGSSDEFFETVEIGEEKSISLDGQSASFEITDYTMSGEELADLTILARYSVPILGQQSQTLDFTFTTGKRISTGSNTYDVFLTDVEYTVTTSGTDGLVLVSGSDEVPFEIGSVVELNGRTIIPISIGSGSTLTGTVLIDPEVYLISDSFMRYPDEQIMIDYGFDRTTGRLSITQSDDDEVFGAYSVNRNAMTITDTYSFELVSEDDSSATYRFHVAGDHTARVEVSENGEVYAQAQTSVLIT